MSDDDYDLQDDSDEEELDDSKDKLSADDSSDDEVDDTDDADDVSPEDLVAAAASTHSSLDAHNKVRNAMQAEIEAFLAKGGKIQKIEDNVMADPPKKPTSNYGSRPI